MSNIIPAQLPPPATPQEKETAEKAKSFLRHIIPSHWPLSALSAGALYGFLAGTLHYVLHDGPSIKNEPFPRWLYSDLLASNKTIVRFAAYGFVFESAAYLIYPQWSSPGRAIDKDLDRLVEYFNLTPPNADKTAFGGALGLHSRGFIPCQAW